MTRSDERPRWILRRTVVLFLALGSACAPGVFDSSWADHYDPWYPDHRIAYELCEESTESEPAFSECMQDAIVPLPDRGVVLSRPDGSRHR